MKIQYEHKTNSTSKIIKIMNSIGQLVEELVRHLFEH